MSNKKVLLIGIDPQYLSHLKLPEGVNPELIRKEAEEANYELEQLGYEVHSCATDLGETAKMVLSEVLSKHKFIAIMIGAGIRAVNDHLILFEEIINVIHQEAPVSFICFNTRPSDSVEAIQRWSNI